MLHLHHKEFRNEIQRNLKQDQVELDVLMALDSWPIQSHHCRLYVIHQSLLQTVSIQIFILNRI